MKIILIYQAATDMPWAASYDAASFARAAAEELLRPAAPVHVKKGDASAYRIYTGTAPASVRTAELLFDFTEPPIATPLLDDVPLRAWRETDKVYPLARWRRMAWAQWRFGGGRQAEKRKDTLARVGELIDRLEAEGRDCIVVSRALTMEALKTALRRRGYTVDGGRLLPKPLDRLRAAKQTERCGGCNHNCPLSSPKCDVGRRKAGERGIKVKEKEK